MNDWAYILNLFNVNYVFPSRMPCIEADKYLLLIEKTIAPASAASHWHLIF